MTTRPSDPDGWYDPDGTDAATLRKIREERETTDRIIYAADEEVPDTTVRDLVKAYARIAELEAALNSMTIERGQAQAERDEILHNKHDRVAELKTEVDLLQGENDRLRDVRESRITELEAANAHSLSERQRLRKEWETANKRIAKLEAERDRLLIAEEDAKLFIYLHALAIECGYMPDPGESAYDLLQRAIMTRCPARAALSGEGVTK